MSGDDALLAWYEARDVFLGINGETASYHRGARLAHECMAKYPDTCPDDAKWFCRHVPERHPTEWIDPGNTAETFLSVALYDGGRALCFAALTHCRVDAPLLISAAKQGYPLAVGLLARGPGCLDGVGNKRIPSDYYGVPIDLRWPVVENCADQREDARCLFALVLQQVVARNGLQYDDDPAIPEYLEKDPVNQKRIKRAAQLGLRSAQLFYAIHGVGLSDSQRISWYGKAARHHKPEDSAMHYFTCVVRQAYQFFFGAGMMTPTREHARCVYQAGLAIKRYHIKGAHAFHGDFKHYNGGNDPHESMCDMAMACVNAQHQWAFNAREAVNTWLGIARRGTFFGVSRDIRIIIGKFIWDLRIVWPKEVV